MEDFTTSDDARVSSKVVELRVEDLFCHQDETSDMDSPFSENKATEWTDEKHTLYLKTMEASFIRHYSDLRCSPSSSNSNSSSDRFKTSSGGGSWQTVNFDRGRSLVRRTEHSDTLISNPWIRRLRPACRGQIMSSSSFDTTDTDQENDSREMSGQNFVGEIVEESSEVDNCNVKRIKIDLGSASTSIGDQIVPFRWLSTLQNDNVHVKTRTDSDSVEVIDH